MELSEHEKNIEWVRALPPMYFASIDQLKALPEYSASMPTGATPGKRWLVNMSFRSGFGNPRQLPAPPVWIVRRYEPAPAEFIMTNLLMTPRGSAKSIYDCSPEDNKQSRRLYYKSEMLAAVPYRPVIRVKSPLEITTV